MLIVEDADSPFGRPNTHGLAAGIDPALGGVPADGLTDAGPADGPELGKAGPHLGWFGPMPIRSHGPHRYVFQVFALDRRLDLPAKFKLGDALNAMSGHVIGRARLEGTFVKRLEVTRSGQRLAPDCLCLGLTLPGNDAKALGWSLQSRQSRLC